MGLTTQEQILIEQRVANEARKSMFVAYVLWFFFGLVGAHRFYLGYTRSGLAMIGLAILSLATAAIVVGGAFAIGLVVWAIADAFLIPTMMKEYRNEVRSRIAADIQISNVANMPVDTSKWSKADRERFMVEQRVGR